jgi:hypothetical protein
MVAETNRLALPEERQKDAAQSEGSAKVQEVFYEGVPPKKNQKKRHKH